MADYGVLLVSGRRTHQEGHAAAFDVHPQCRLVAVTDEKDVPEKRHDLNRQLADDYGIPYMPDLEEALALDGVDIVSSCADVERRGRVAVRCAEAGKHVYLDKPLAGTLEDADAIVAAVEWTGVKSQMYTSIFSPFAQAAKNAIESGRVGELKAVHAEVLFAKGKPATVPDGTIRREKAQVGRYTFVEGKREMFDIGVYPLALVHYLTGRKTESVFALTGNYMFEDHAKLDIEDFGALALTMEDGVTATVLGGRIGWTSHPKGGPQRIVLIGTKGSLTFDANQPRIEIYNDEPDFTMPYIHADDPMGMWASTQRESDVMPKCRWMTLGEHPGLADDVAAFIDCIENNHEPAMSARRAAPLTEAILAGYASAARGVAVALPLRDT